VANTSEIKQIPNLKGHELKRLRKIAKSTNGHPVISTLQHEDIVIVTSKGSVGIPLSSIARSERADSASYGIFIYSLNWETMYHRFRNL
jgi:hypothetical protein